MIGPLSRRVVLERPDRTEDDGGGAVVVWTPVATVWASIASSPAGDLAAQDDLIARVAHRVRLRWRSDVLPGWRLKLGERVFRVVAAVDRDGARRWLHLDCEEERR